MKSSDENRNLYKNSDNINHFYMMPNIIDDMNLSISEYRLYGHLKRVTGEDGSCWQSERKIAEKCNMSIVTVVKCKKSLEKKGLINIIEKSGGHGIYHEIIITDIWEMNSNYSKRNNNINNDNSESDSEEYRKRFNPVSQAIQSSIASDSFKILKEYPIKNTPLIIPPPPTPQLKENPEKQNDVVEVVAIQEKDDHEFKKIVKEYESEIGIITPLVAEEIKVYLEQDKIPPKYIIDAIHQSSIHNVRSWSYISAIIDRWIAQGNQDDYRKKKKDDELMPGERGWSTV